MVELFNALFTLGAGALCVFLLRSKGARTFIRRNHPPSQTEVGLMGWLVILGIVGMAFIVFGVYMLVDSIIKLAR